MIKARKLQHPSDDFILQQKAAKKGKKVFIIQAAIFLFCCFIIGISRGSIFAFMSKVGGTIGTSIGKGTRTLISKSIGTQPKLDAQGNLNIALIGYGGLGHDGSFLTDAMIVASINPKKGTMSMLSIPRDFYVKKPNGNYGKINSIFEGALYSNDKDYEKAAPSLLNKLTDITGIPLTYYAFIDFKGFEKFVDMLGGVEIDVPEPLYDSSYPGANDSYIVFSVNSGTQVMNGETALRYARSRHSTSDYARSLRQQAIIQALLDKLTKAGTILNPVKAKSIYASVGEFLHTNVSMDEVLRLIPYNGTIKHKSSRQIAVCASYQRETAQAGCLAYTPPMESMGGASVQIPAGASPSNVSNYDVIQSFVQDTVMNTDFLAEASSVRVLNGINTGEFTKFRTIRVANNVAIDLVKGGFTIYDIGNAPAPQAQTTIVTNGEGRDASIKKLKVFFPTAIVSSAQLVPEGPSIILTIGNDYASGQVQQKSLPLYLQY